MMAKARFVKGNGAPLARPRSILLIQLGDIGDVVLSTPCIHALRDHFPEARLAVAVRDKAAELLTECCPWLDEVIAVRKASRGVLGEAVGQLDLLRTLRRLSCDLAIDLRTGTRGAILARLSGASRRIGFFADNEAWWRNALFTDLLICDYTTDPHMVDYLLHLLESFGVPACSRLPELASPPARLAEADRLLATTGQECVVLQPFSLWCYKEWGEENVVKLIRQLIKERKVTVLITGTAAEAARAAKIQQACGQDSLNLAGKTSLALYAAVLKRSRLFIGMDSAGLHIAAAVGIPTVSLFGPSSPQSWAPRQGAGHVVVQKAWPCVPCREKGCQGTGISRCLDELSLAKVMAAVDQQLNIT